MQGEALLAGLEGEGEEEEAAVEGADGQTGIATTPTLSRTEGTERWRNVWDCDWTLESRAGRTRCVV